MTMPVGLPHLLNSAMVRLLRLARKADRQSPIGPAQLSALSVLYFSGDLSTTALAEAEQVSQPTISRIAASLHKAGAITRLPSGSDARSTLLQITPLGRKIFEAARAERLKVIESVLAYLSPASAEQLNVLLSSLLEAIDSASTSSPEASSEPNPP